MWMPRATVVVLVLLAGVAGIVGATAEGFADAAELATTVGGDAAASDRPPLALALGGTLVGIGWAASGAVLAWLRPGNLVGWLVLAVGTVTQLSLTEEAVAAAGWLGADAAAGDWMARPIGLALTLIGGWGIMTMLGSLPAIYPDGRLPSRRWWWPVAVVALGAVLIQVQWSADEEWLRATPAQRSMTDAADGALVAIPAIVYFAGAATIWVLAAVALFRSPPPRRQQLAWLLGSVVVVLIASVLGDSIPMQVVQIASLYLLPVAIAIGLLRYRLLGIDASPRADPMRAVAEIGTQVASSEDGELLGAVLTSVRRAVDAPGARVRDESGDVIATSGDLANAGFSAGLAVGGIPVGVLEVAPRSPGERFGSRDERMLRALAAQLAAVVRAQGLAEQLEAQRDSVVVARTTERERLRRELHDGLGPALTGIGLGLDGLTDAVATSDGPRALEIAGILRSEVGDTVSEVRRILDDLHPAAIDERGFADALRRSVTAVAATLPVDVRIGRLPALPARVEQAAYRVVGEAVTNAVRHADASRLDVRVEADETGRLVIEVRDDGAGFDPAAPPARGIGLDSMRDRARELGGLLTMDSTVAGTIVTLAVPIAAGGTVGVAVTDGAPVA